MSRVSAMELLVSLGAMATLASPCLGLPVLQRGDGFSAAVW
jgi:hypothetical protein